MTQYLFSFDEAIDSKFIVNKTLSGQAKAGTMIHVLDCVPKGNGGCTVWYRVTETGQDFSLSVNSLKEFCNWARTDKILIRHYNSISHKDVMQYMKITNRGFLQFYVPILAVILLIVWIALMVTVGGVFGAVLAAVLSIAAFFAILFVYRSQRKKAIFNIYSKVGKNNWGVIIK